MERLEKLKLILGIEGTEQDDILNYLLQSTERTILNYCHIQVLPPELEDLLVEMAADKYRSQTRATNIKIGDTSETFSENKDGIRPEHRAQLNRFRRLQWL